MCMTIKEKYIDPFTDFGFKWLFGTEENKRFLISFLNDLLDLEHQIVTIEYRNLEKLGLSISDRKAIFDIFCTDEKDNNFIVELQRSKQRYFKDRSVYYTSFPIQEQSKKGDWDYELNKVYFIGILEFNMSEKEIVVEEKNEDKKKKSKKKEDKEEYLTKVQLYDTKRGELFYDKLTYYYLEMPKFQKSETELSNHLEHWLYMLNNMAKLEKVPKVFKDDDLINDAFDIARFLELSKDKQFAYQHDLKTRLDYKNVMDYAVETALEQGRDEGIEQGIEEGKKNKQLEIAKNLLKVGLDIKTIALSTGLTIKMIEKLSSFQKEKICV